MLFPLSTALRCMPRMLAALSLLLIAAACGPIYDTHYDYYYPKHPEGRVCTSQCGVSQNYCKQQCRSNENQCRSWARQEAQHEYEHYLHEVYASGYKPKHRLDHFVSDYHCSDYGCEEDCEELYRGCFASCGGEIRSKQVCTAFCGKAQ